MHRKFREALKSAVGVSEFIVAVVVDIRGFSAFSTAHESPDTAMYIKRVYASLINDYFANASFFKPTGDGLLVTIPFTEGTLKKVAQDTVRNCLRCVREFPNICKDDPMVNFDTPQNIGIGIARGTACCLKSGRQTLDYSGQLLNLTSRLMDLARPAGLVLDDSLGVDLLGKRLGDKFEQEEVYLRGIAEFTPRRIWYQTGKVEIGLSAKQPPLENWEEETITRTLREWKKLGPVFQLFLRGRLKHPSAFIVESDVRSYIKGRRVKGVSESYIFEPQREEVGYRSVANKHGIVLHLDKLLPQICADGLKQHDRVGMAFRYILAPPKAKTK